MKRPTAALVLLLAACGGEPDEMTGNETAADTGRDDTGSPDDGTGTGTDDDGLSPAERASLEDELPRPDAVAGTESAMGHFHIGRQASSYRRGPQGEGLLVQPREFENVAGEDFGASPWHVVSTRRYSSPTARTVWGASLQWVYKFAVDGDTFEFAGKFRLNEGFTSITWNLIGLDDGRVVVPDPDGYRAGDGDCGGTEPAFLVLRDDTDGAGDPMSAIECEKKLEFEPAALRELCDASGFMVRGPTGTGSLILFEGELASTVVFQDQGVRRHYLIVADPGLDAFVACGLIDDSAPTNEYAGELLPDGRTAVYVPTGDAIVKLVYDSAAQTVERRWERPVGVRDRLGTTPTLVNAANGDQLVVVVDARCATSNVVNGLIVCDDDDSPSRLVGVRREDDLGNQPAVISIDLPGVIRTVENSPAARGDTIVVANYSGYLPNGLLVPPGGQPPNGGLSSNGASPDSVADIATGAVAVTYRNGGFDIAWVIEDQQVSGVPTISGGGNLVYGTGAEIDGRTYLYGFLLEDDDRGAAGTVAVRLDIGAAPFRTPQTRANGEVFIPLADYSFGPGEFFDAGNNLVLLPDRSLLVSGGRGLVRIYE